jgi:hypothetical protein
MIDATTRVRQNEAEIAAKVVDGEAIMINLSNGIYYSLDNAGGLIWELLTSGHSLGESGRIVSERFEVSVEDARTDVTRLTEELLREGLVAIVNDGTPQPLGPAGNGGGRATYRSPTLEVYRDIGHLIALDPPMPGLKDVSWNEPDQP